MSACSQGGHWTHTGPARTAMRSHRDGRCLLSVLLVRNLLHPVDGLSVECLGNSDVSHPLARRCAVPMLDAGGKPDHVTLQYFLLRAAFDLHPSAATPLRSRDSVPAAARSARASTPS